MLRAGLVLDRLVGRNAGRNEHHAIEPQLGPGFACANHVGEVRRVEGPAEDADGRQLRTCPSPSTRYLAAHSSRTPIGPRACSFCVELPISAPIPNSAPSVKRVEALTYTHAASTSSWKRRPAAASRVTIASLWPVPCAAMCSIAASSESTTATASVSARYSVSQSASPAGAISM